MAGIFCIDCLLFSIFLLSDAFCLGADLNVYEEWKSLCTIILIREKSEGP